MVGGGRSSAVALGALLPAVLFAVAPARVARAGQSQDEPTRPTIAIVLAGGDASADAALTASLRRSLERFDAAVTWERTGVMNPRDVIVSRAPMGKSDNKTPAIRVWIDLGAARRATVYVAEDKSVFVRPLVLDRGLDTVALDLLDVVVTTAVDTVLSGRPLGITREEFSRTLPPPDAAPAAPPSPVLEQAATPPSPAPTSIGRWLSLAASYEGVLAASGQPVHGPGILLEAERSQFRVGVGAHGHFPYDVSAAGATVHLRSGGVRLYAGRVFPLGARLALAIALGGGVDVTRVSARADQPDVTPAPDFTAVDPVLRPLVTLERRWGTTAVAATLGVDVDLTRPRYVVQSVSTTQPVWTPSPFRPLLALAIRLGL